MALNVTLDYQFSSPIEKVWFALTDANTLSKWIMANDFKPFIGHKFQFRTEPSEWWNGIIDCEVLEIEEPNRLSYTWVSGGKNTIITWTLEYSNGITFLHFEQSGFESEDQAYKGAKYGWVRMIEEMEKLLNS